MRRDDHTPSDTSDYQMDPNAVQGRRPVDVSDGAASMSELASLGLRRPVTHMIGHAHLDLAWLWHWMEGRQETRATFWSAIDRMNESDGFSFTSNQVVSLTWVEETDERLFAAIRERVDEGRWELAGGWWVEADCNLPSGESLVRQGLYGQRYLAEKFGVIATVGLNVDVFGHGLSLPQILRGQGLQNYCFFRPMRDEKQLPIRPFEWESPDGSRVLTYRIPVSYQSNDIDLRARLAKCLRLSDPDSSFQAVFYGVGNHGGGPTRKNIDTVNNLIASGEMGPVHFSRLDRFFDAVTRSSDERPVVKDELQIHAPGCYSVHSAIKAWNRKAESEVQAAEKWATITSRTLRMPYAKAELTRAWKQLLFNQFHDILPGTATEAVYEDARDQLGESIAISRRVVDRAAQSIAARIDVPYQPCTQPVVVFNSLAWPVTAQVEVEFGGNAEHPLLDGELEIVDSTGLLVPSQEIQVAPVVQRPSKRRRLTLVADIPSLGYQLYSIQAAGRGTPSPRASQDSLVLENEWLRAQIDPHSGWLAHLVDKESGASFVNGESAHTVVTSDDSDTWGHGVISYVRDGDAFRVRSAGVHETGPVRTSIRVISEYANSTLIEDYILLAGCRFIDVRAMVEWHETCTLFKIRVPTALKTVVAATREIPYGAAAMSTDGRETPGQSWIDVRGHLDGGQAAGLAVITDVKPACDVTGASIGVTVVRSPAYAWDKPRTLDPDETRAYIDQGRQQFHYRLVPHDGTLSFAQLTRMAEEIRTPLRAHLEGFHGGGEYPPRQSFASSDGTGVLLTVLKAAEDAPEDAVVVRAVEANGTSVDARICLDFLPRTFDAHFEPYEIKTFLVPADPDSPVEETNLLEWNEEDMAARTRL